MNTSRMHLVFRRALWLTVATLAILLPCGYAFAGKAPSIGAVTRTINFSGYIWSVKNSTEPVGPGPNYFSDSIENVWVDGSGSLHMKIANRGGKWYCSEVISNLPLNYGSYTWAVTSPLNALDPNAVLGLFTWDDNAPQYNYREIDIEIARWKVPGGPNLQYVVQPYYNPGSRYQFNMPLTNSSVHRFDWSAAHIQFDSWEGALHESWIFTNPAAIPPAGTGNARINLWLFDGTPPTDGKDIEVVIQSFRFQYPYLRYLPVVLRSN